MFSLYKADILRKCIINHRCRLHVKLNEGIGKINPVQSRGSSKHTAAKHVTFTSV